MRGPIDGSAPPRKTKIDVTTKDADDKKFTQHLTFDRTPAEKDDDDETKKDDEKPKKDKPKKKDTAEKE